MKLQRHLIDKLDLQILQLFKERIYLSKSVALSKKEQGLPVENLGREAEVLNNLKTNYPDVDSEFIEDLYKVVFKHSKKEQEKLIND